MRALLTGATGVWTLGDRLKAAVLRVTPDAQRLIAGAQVLSETDPLSSGFDTSKTVKAGFWRWLETVKARFWPLQTRQSRPDSGLCLRKSFKLFNSPLARTRLIVAWSPHSRLKEETNFNSLWMPRSKRWSTTFSSKVNLPHAINFRALCGVNLVT